MAEDDWYLLKAADNNQAFGPIPLEQLRIWASSAKISPMDRVSNDGQRSWLKAPMVLQLQMDWLVEMPDNYLYGPTSVGTLQEFLAIGEIDEHVTVINTLDGSRSRINELAFFSASPQRIRGTHELDADLGTGGAHGEDTGNATRHRCAWLEKQVMDLQREVNEWQEHYGSLRAEFLEATGRDPR